ncbi:hypothetical protein [Bacillus xiapuensis]|uniref:Uncharacterized protein n=1 Tax=Bacillus xiapuensis TaxID=2014075 RepID=A0ABU6N8V5_9BACI|nr:hypothetical protein [Bacillus xiapuensis]
MKREFVFELKEIKNEYDNKMSNNKRAIVHVTTGTVNDREDITIMVDDPKQPYGMFEVKDNLFKKIINKLHNVTK